MVRLCKGPVLTADILVLSENQNRGMVAAWGVPSSSLLPGVGGAHAERQVRGRVGRIRTQPGCSLSSLVHGVGMGRLLVSLLGLT